MLLALVTVLSVLLGSACTARSSAPAQPASATGTNGTAWPRNRPAKVAPSPGFSWSVRGKSTVITLVGSIHIGFEGLYPLPVPVEEAFRESKALAMELALDQETPEKISDMMISQARLPEGKSLRDCLSDRTWLRYQAFAEEHSAQAMFFNQFRPWFVAIFLSGEKATIDGYDPNQGIDIHFYKQRGTRRVIGVEKAEQHIRALADLPAATQDLMLAEQLDAMTNNVDDMEILVKFWKTGDDKGLEQELFAEFRNPEYAPVYDALIVKRNARMAAQIEKWLAGKERVFVVLGAAHFIGRNGIIARLEEDGWAPERL